MYCQNCGTELEAGMKFCPNCGTPAAGNLPKQEAPKPEASRPAVIPQQNIPQQSIPQQSIPQQYDPQRAPAAPAAAYPAPVLQQPPQRAAAPEKAKKVSKRWPVASWIFCILAIIIAAFAAYVTARGNMIYMRPTVFSYLLGGIRQYRLAMWLESVAIVFPFLFAAILFMTKTKKAAWLTALPLTIYLIGFVFGRYVSNTEIPAFQETWLEIYLYFAELLIAALLWWLLVCIRPKSKALAVIFLVFAISLSLAVLAAKIVVWLLYYAMSGPIASFLLGSILIACADLLLMIAYSIAGFSVRKKSEL